MWIFVLIGLAIVIGMYAISMQRQLVSMDELAGNALSQIGVQQNSRWDALKALAELTKGYSEHEYKTLMDVIGKRANISSNSSATEANVQEGLLNQAFGRLFAVAEQYPNLKANETYIKTMDSLNNYENNVRMSRMVYNDTVTKMNRLVRQFPGSIFAGMFGFKTREYLKEPEGKTEMPPMA